MRSVKMVCMSFMRRKKMKIKKEMYPQRSTFQVLVVLFHKTALHAPSLQSMSAVFTVPNIRTY